MLCHVEYLNLKMMEGVESKKITTKFYNKVKFCIRAGSMTARNKSRTQEILTLTADLVKMMATLSHHCLTPL